MARERHQEERHELNFSGGGGEMQTIFILIGRRGWYELDRETNHLWLGNTAQVDSALEIKRPKAVISDDAMLSSPFAVDVNR